MNSTKNPPSVFPRVASSPPRPSLFFSPFLPKHSDPFAPLHVPGYLLVFRWDWVLGLEDRAGLGLERERGDYAKGREEKKLEI